MELLDERQCNALDAAVEAPARVVDSKSAATCVLLKRADFDWVRELLPDEPDARRLVDPRSQEVYAIVPVDRYERFKAFFEEDPLSPAEKDGLLRTAGIRAGWDDPAFDVYDGAGTRP